MQLRKSRCRVEFLGGIYYTANTISAAFVFFRTVNAWFTAITNPMREDSRMWSV